MQLLSLRLISEPSETFTSDSRDQHELPCARSHTLTALITCPTSLLTHNIKDIAAGGTRPAEPEHTHMIPDDVSASTELQSEDDSLDDL